MFKTLCLVELLQIIVDIICLLRIGYLVFFLKIVFYSILSIFFILRRHWLPKMTKKISLSLCFLVLLAYQYIALVVVDPRETIELFSKLIRIVLFLILFRIEFRIFSPIILQTINLFCLLWYKVNAFEWQLVDGLYLIIA